MRGSDQRSGSLFSYVDLERRAEGSSVAGDPDVIVDVALSALEWRVRGDVRASGRPSIAPEKLLRALLLQAFYTVRSERQLMERLEFDLLFRWFVGLGIDDRVWDHSVFSKNRERLLKRRLLRGSSRPFSIRARSEASVRRALLGRWNTGGVAWASLEELQGPKRGKDGGTSLRHHRDANEEVDFRGEKRSNQTHASTTLIRTLGSIARDQAWKPSSASSVTP